MVRHVDATHPSFDPSAAKAKFAGNFPDGIASFKESPDLVEDLLSDSLAVAAYPACPCDRIRTTIRAGGKRRQRLIAAAADPRIPDRRLIPTKLALDGFAEVLHQMESIGDLPGLWRALTRGLGIEPGTGAADDVNVGVIFEPISRGRRRTIRQHVHNRTTLQIHDDCAVLVALPPCPVVDASHAHDGRGAAFGPNSGVLHQAGQDRRVADRHSEPSHKSL